MPEENISDPLATPEDAVAVPSEESVVQEPTATDPARPLLAEDPPPATDGSH